MKKIHIIGLGLLGGSFALAIKKSHPDWVLTGFDNQPKHLETALELGMIVEKKEVPDPDTDAVVLATPVDSLFGLLTRTLDQVGPGTLMMDFGSTKYEICRKIGRSPQARLNTWRSILLLVQKIRGPKRQS
jgi:prephenate dehydrogenase